MLTSIVESEPSSYEEAARQHVWREAMAEEYASIMKNNVWKVVLRPEGKSVITSRWLYKIKYVADGSTEKYKARFVARGFSQIEGVDYDETSTPIARYTSIHSIITIVAKMKVYIEQPHGFELHGRESHVCRLKKALHGLKQAPRAWYSWIDAYLQQLGF